MGKLKRDLQAVTRELKALTKKTQRLMNDVDKLEKGQPAKKPKAGTKARAKTARKASAKKKTKSGKKAPAKQKAAKLTSTDQALNIIKRSKKGVDAPTLMKKTGFDDKKIRNIISKAFGQGKIKRTGRGVYIGA